MVGAMLTSLMKSGFGFTHIYLSSSRVELNVSLSYIGIFKLNIYSVLQDEKVKQEICCRTV